MYTNLSYRLVMFDTRVNRILVSKSIISLPNKILWKKTLCRRFGILFIIRMIPSIIVFFRDVLKMF